MFRVLRSVRVLEDLGLVFCMHRFCGRNHADGGIWGDEVGVGGGGAGLCGEVEQLVIL